jgi:hypothetical protein
MVNFLSGLLERLLDILNKPKELTGESEFGLIGPCKSGKTTFLAALARWPNASKDSPVESVDPYDDDTKDLVTRAKNILESGLDFTPDQAEDLLNYTLSIKLKSTFFDKNLDFQVSFKEYSGELFEDFIVDGKISEYLGDISNVSGFLVLIDGTSAENDKKYAQFLVSLKKELRICWIAEEKKLKDIRLAVVFSKAEEAQVWIYRRDLPGFMNRKFPLSTEVLVKWQKEWRCSINYFFCSAFGTMGKPPQPNTRPKNHSQGGTSAVIKRPDAWRPLGLVAPIYWLYTGKDDQRLRKLEDN